MILAKVGGGCSNFKLKLMQYYLVTAEWGQKRDGRAEHRVDGRSKVPFVLVPQP